MWGFSNLACCSSEILQNVYDSPFLIQNIFEATLNDEDPKVIYQNLYFLYFK